MIGTGADRPGSCSRLLLFDHTLELVRSAGGTLSVTPEPLATFHRIAVGGLYGCAGEFRREPVTIDRSRHVPPRFREVSSLVAEMCEYANAACGPDGRAIHAAAYVLWRVNWVHPFLGGNGRVARSLAYLALCVGFDMELPGTYTIVEQIVRRPDEYYAALEEADRAATEGRIDVGHLESMLSDMLIRQLESAV